MYLFMQLKSDEVRSIVTKSAALSLVVGFALTNYLIPIIATFTLKKGLFGKDLGKKGTSRQDVHVPEALGLVPATCFLICAILSQLLFADDVEGRVLYTSALFSVCFMIFLGFTDDTLDLAWRYKLVLPTIASLPLLAAYSGETALYVPPQLRHLLVRADGHTLTVLASTINTVATVDTEAGGAIVELDYLFMVFMGLLAVFCTNSINILAGINGLECGQSVVIACAILVFKLYELAYVNPKSEPALFVVTLLLPFITSSIGLLRHNWYPANVFVGDTYCYFAGMTFAVMGILGHFSKTLLLLFAPQVLNFLYSAPQLFKFIPCPRHRLPRCDPETQLLHSSTFRCKKSEFAGGLWALLRVKADSDAEEAHNMTIICLALRLAGPMTERSLCLLLLSVQVLCSAAVFYVRFCIFE
jgi:UDP-N-acetylglucosamine--dolichyl-phosphate N-acetylglucosaminephosphotransferase